MNSEALLADLEHADPRLHGELHLHPGLGPEGVYLRRSAPGVPGDGARKQCDLRFVFSGRDARRQRVGRAGQGLGRRVGSGGAQPKSTGQL